MIRRGKLGERPLAILELIVCLEAELDKSARNVARTVGSLVLVRGSWVLRHAALLHGLDEADVAAFWDALASSARKLVQPKPVVSAAPVFLHFAA